MKKKRDGRKIILMLALEEFSNVGIRASSLNDILRKSGLSKGAFYHHFNSKDDIVYAVLDEILSDWVIKKYSKILKSNDNYTKGLYKLSKFNSGGSSQLDKQLEKLFLGIIFESSNLEPKVQGLVKNLLTRIESLLVKFACKQRLNLRPRQASTLIFATLIGNQVLSLAKGSKMTYKKSIVSFIQLLSNSHSAS